MIDPTLTYSTKTDNSTTAPCPEWTSWPTYTGQQFVSLGREMWVGNVEVGRTDTLYGTKLTVWRGGAHYTVWSTDDHGFRFRQIVWPPIP